MHIVTPKLCSIPNFQSASNPKEDQMHKIVCGYLEPKYLMFEDSAVTPLIAY